MKVQFRWDGKAALSSLEGDYEQEALAAPPLLRLLCGLGRSTKPPPGDWQDIDWILAQARQAALALQWIFVTDNDLATRPLVRDDTLFTVTDPDEHACLYISLPRNLLRFDGEQVKLLEDGKLGPGGAPPRKRGLWNKAPTLSPTPYGWTPQKDEARFLTSWSPETATLELSGQTPGGSLPRLRLVSTDDGDLGVVPQHRVCVGVKGLGFPRSFGPFVWAHATVQEGHFPQPLPIGPDATLDFSGVRVSGPIPESIRVVVAPQAHGPHDEAPATWQGMERTFAVATRLSELRWVVGGIALETLRSDQVAEALHFRSEGPFPASLTVTVTNPRGTSTLRLESTSPTTARFTGDLASLVRGIEEPTVLRLEAPGQGLLGHLVVAPPSLSGEWRPHGDSRLGFFPTGRSAPLRDLARPTNDPSSGSQLERTRGPSEPCSSAIWWQARDLTREGGETISVEVPLVRDRPHRAGRADPRPGSPSKKAVELTCPLEPLAAIHQWYPGIPVGMIRAPSSKAGRLRLDLGVGLFAVLKKQHLRVWLELEDGTRTSGWVHSHRWPVVPPFERCTSSGGGVHEVPIGSRLFVDCRGLTAEARLTTIVGTGPGETYQALLLDAPGWNVDGRAAAWPDGASLAPVQAAVEVDLDEGRSHYWVQELGADPLIIEHFEALRSRTGDWAIESAQGDLPPFGPATDWDPVTLDSPLGHGTIPLLNSVVGGRASWLVRWRHYLLSLGSPEDPRVRFRGWIWPVGSAGRYPAQPPYGPYVLQAVVAGEATERWTGAQSRGGIHWDAPEPPAALQAAVAQCLAAARPTAGKAIEIRDGPSRYHLTPELSADGRSVRLALDAGHTPQGMDETGIRIWHERVLPPPLAPQPSPAGDGQEEPP